MPEVDPTRATPVREEAPVRQDPSSLPGLREVLNSLKADPTKADKHSVGQLLLMVQNFEGGDAQERGKLLDEVIELRNSLRE